MCGQILSGEQQYAGNVLKELAAAEDSEGNGKWTETKKYLASVKLTGRSTKCNLGGGGLGGEKKESPLRRNDFQNFNAKIGVFFLLCEDVGHFQFF